MERGVGRLAHAPSQRRLARRGQVHIANEAKDGSAGFDFEGIYTSVEPNKLIEYKMADDREVSVEFSETDNGVLVKETFDAETENDPEMQRAGWQAILDTFAKYVEANRSASAAEN